MLGALFANVAPNIRRGYRGIARSYQRDGRNRRGQVAKIQGTEELVHYFEGEFTVSRELLLWRLMAWGPNTRRRSVKTGQQPHP